eukprot:GEMP01122152.1.p1 GENE.GEMP01122152.1~~GEMP01122152.1.p1  ORF type:complete len:156 (+),score=19.34 GEMP01122152.1:33-470(+)
MYSHNAWHNFWQQRVQKERIVQERHLPEYHGRHRDTCPDFSSQNGVRDALLTKRSLSVRSDYRSSRPTNEIKYFDNGQKMSGNVELDESLYIISPSLKLEVENLVRQQMLDIVTPLQKQLWVESNRRRVVERKIRQMRKHRTILE